MTNEPESMERHNRIPRGYYVLFLALAAWGLYYIVAYTPRISGWSQYKVLETELAAEKARIVAAAVKLTENPYEHDPKGAAEGKGIYAENCEGCHGKDLKGDSGPSLREHFKYGETDGQKYESIARGRPGGMPPFDAPLGRDRIWKALAYVDSVREYGKTP